MQDCWNIDGHVVYEKSTGWYCFSAVEDTNFKIEVTFLDYSSGEQNGILNFPPSPLRGTVICTVESIFFMCKSFSCKSWMPTKDSILTCLLVGMEPASYDCHIFLNEWKCTYRKHILINKRVQQVIYLNQVHI